MYLGDFAERVTTVLVGEPWSPATTVVVTAASRVDNVSRTAPVDAHRVVKRILARLGGEPPCLCECARTVDVDSVAVDWALLELDRPGDEETAAQVRELVQRVFPRAVETVA